MSFSFPPNAFASIAQPQGSGAFGQSTLAPVQPSSSTFAFTAPPGLIGHRATPHKRAASPAASDTSSRPPSPTSLLGSETSVSATLLAEASEDSHVPVTRHKDMYFDSMIVFKAGNTLFKIPRYGLPEEGVFFDMFTLPEMEGSTDGISDDNPVVLPPQVTAHDFQSLLKACHPLVQHKDSKLVLNEWLSVVKLSTIWCMDQLRARAIIHCEGLFPMNYSSVERLLLGRELRIAGWMIKAYEELGRRSALLNARERELLGAPRSFKIMELRERSMRWAEKQQGRSRTQYDFRRKAKQLFAEDLVRDKDYKP